MTSTQYIVSCMSQSPPMLGTCVTIRVNPSPGYWLEGKKTTCDRMSGIFLYDSLSGDQTKICRELPTFIRWWTLLWCPPPPLTPPTTPSAFQPFTTTHDPHTHSSHPTPHPPCLHSPTHHHTNPYPTPYVLSPVTLLPYLVSHLYPSPLEKPILQ